ncbi:hypothetical protein RNN91_04500 [Mycoplasmopsis felis]|uniref:hypothetical protein n=1 Tax=Mycoplasmopsis felis TaxID=33923 RepID=UPI002AF6A666|nr:hypothetical protein [Mycoplasmopsis felis]WQQ01559.1 hypothetical protein RRG54_03145 [Mycoplasmopsis felis]
MQRKNTFNLDTEKLYIIETLFETNENNKKDFQNYVLIKKFTDFIHSKLDI